MNLSRKWCMSACAILVSLVLSLVAGCAGSGSTNQPQPSPEATMAEAIRVLDVASFEAEHPGRWVETSEDAGFESVSVVNYEPGVFPVPEYQEVVSWERSYSLDSRQLVISVWVRQSEGQFYTRELDPQDRSVLHEEGTWFLDADQEAFVAEQVKLLDELMGWS